MHKPLFAALVVSAFAPQLSAAEGKWSVRVEAGGHDRTDAVLTFPMPAMTERPNVVYQGTRRTPLQFPVGASNASFVLLELREGKTANYRLAREPEFATVDAFKVTREDGKVDVRPVLNRPGVQHFTQRFMSNALFQYQAEPGPFPRADIKELFRRGAYLHPIRTRSGRTVTDDFPPNHIHHHGVWWAWTSTGFDGRKPDFWNMGQGKGRVDFVAVDTTWTGPVHGGFASRHRFVDMTGPKHVAALEETWEVTAYDVAADNGRAWFFDLVSSQRCSGTNALKLPEYRYGGIGLRGNWAWNGAANARFLTSDGETNRLKAHTQRARWCDMSGVIDGEFAGIAVLCHPSNFRAPQPMRVHETEPFFCYAPQQLGDMQIKPDDNYVSRYRFVVHDGAISRDELDRIWNDYAHPPVVRVSAE